MFACFFIFIILVFALAEVLYVRGLTPSRVYAARLVCGSRGYLNSLCAAHTGIEPESLPKLHAQRLHQQYAASWTGGL
jgi:hypothetical protein